MIALYFIYCLFSPYFDTFMGPVSDPEIQWIPFLRSIPSLWRWWVLPGIQNALSNWGVTNPRTPISIGALSQKVSKSQHENDHCSTIILTCPKTIVHLIFSVLIRLTHSGIESASESECGNLSIITRFEGISTLSIADSSN